MRQISLRKDAFTRLYLPRYRRARAFAKSGRLNTPFIHIRLPLPLILLDTQEYYLDKFRVIIDFLYIAYFGEFQSYAVLHHYEIRYAATRRARLRQADAHTDAYRAQNKRAKKTMKLSSFSLLGIKEI